MVALQIRDVPDEVRDVLAKRARERGQSLQAFLLAVAKAEARRVRNTSLLAQFSGHSDGSRVLSGETAAELEQIRGARDT
jgi:hypothetical protein